MINMAVMREPYNWFVVFFAAAAGLLLMTLLHPMVQPKQS